MNNNHWGQRIMTWALPMLILGAFVLSAYGVYQSRARTRERRLDTCHQLNANRKLLHDVLVLARSSSARPDDPFWAEALVKTRPATCS